MEVRTIRDCIDKKSNNLNLIKFIAAILVIFSHSFRISRNTMDPLDSFTDGQISFGGVAVALFLFASGFYVTKGLFKRKKGVLYFKNRFARIYPAFVAVIIATAFIIGPLISKYSFKEYFGRKDTYLYLLYILMIPRYILPGVFEKNPYPGVVNGSLWTIPLEVICYIGLYIVYVCKFLNKKVLKILNPLLLIGICVIFGFRVTGIYKYHLYLRPLLIFFMGIQYYIFRDEIKLDRKKALEILVVAFGLFCYIGEILLQFIVSHISFLCSCFQKNKFQKKSHPWEIIHMQSIWLHFQFNRFLSVVLVEWILLQILYMQVYVVFCLE